MARGDRFRPGSVSVYKEPASWASSEAQAISAVLFEEDMEELRKAPLVAALPHQCDAWVIGTKADVKALIAELESILPLFDSGTWKND